MLCLKKKKKQKYKEWRMDTLRADDFNQMRLMAKELAKLRKEDKYLGGYGKKSQTSRQATQKEKAASESTQRPQTGNTTSTQVRNRMQQHYSKAR